MADQCVDTDEGECPPAKKIKIEIENAAKNDDSLHEAEINLSTFEMKRILQNNNTRKQIYIEGTFKGSESPAILSLEKTTFPTDELFLKQGFFNEDTTIQKVYSNHIYGNYRCFPIKEYNGKLIYTLLLRIFSKFTNKSMNLICFSNYEKIVEKS